MDVNKKGGKRNGSGRKPSGIEKETVSIYVEKSKIWRFGTKENLKKELYNFIDNFGETTNEIKPIQQQKNLNEPTNTKELKPEKTTNTSIDTRRPFMSDIIKKKLGRN